MTVFSPPKWELEGKIDGDSLLAWLAGHRESPLLPHDARNFSEEGKQLSPDAETKTQGSTVGEEKEVKQKAVGSPTGASCGECENWREIPLSPLSPAFSKKRSVRRSLSVSEKRPT